MQIKLSEVENVKQFVRIVEASGIDVILSHGRYQVDGSSLLGVLSLNLSDPVDIIILSDNLDEKRQFLSKIGEKGLIFDQK